MRKLTPHATRHTFISIEHRARANRLNVKRIVGHASGDVTDKISTHVELEELRKAVEMLAGKSRHCVSNVLATVKKN